MAAFIPDINILVGAFRKDSDSHNICKIWINELLASQLKFRMPDVIISGFVRVITNPKIYREPNTVNEAFNYISWLKAELNCIRGVHHQSHLKTFSQLCNTTEATGNLVSDAYLAAIAIDYGDTLVSLDQDFYKFSHLGLDWIDLKRIHERELVMV